MDALYLSILVAALLICCGQAQAAPMQETDEASAEVVSDTQTTAAPTTDPQTPQDLCTSSRALPGRCVARASCDYGTPNIDFTMYAPHGYIKACKTAEVCCPVEAVVEATPTPVNNLQDDNAFDFDEDD